MFKQISKIKVIKHFNASLNQERLKFLYQQAVKEHEKFKTEVEEFQSYRLITEKKIVTTLLGEIVSLTNIDLMNEKISRLRSTETGLRIEVRNKEQAEESAYSHWQDRIRIMVKAQKSVDKFDYVVELERFKESERIQYREDLELEEFKPIKLWEHTLYE
jgi:hypothetical protein